MVDTHRPAGKEPTSAWSQTQAYWLKSSALRTELQPPDKSWSSKFPLSILPAVIATGNLALAATIVTCHQNPARDRLGTPLHQWRSRNLVDMSEIFLNILCSPGRWIICKEWLTHTGQEGKKTNQLPSGVGAGVELRHSDWQSSALCTELKPPDKSWSSKFPQVYCQW